LDEKRALLCGIYAIMQRKLPQDLMSITVAPDEGKDLHFQPGCTMMTISLPDWVILVFIRVTFPFL
jgi:hypothetical protein